MRNVSPNTSGRDMDDNLDFGFQDIMEFVASTDNEVHCGGGAENPGDERRAHTMFQFEDERLPRSLK